MAAVFGDDAPELSSLLVVWALQVRGLPCVLETLKPLSTPQEEPSFTKKGKTKNKKREQSRSTVLALIAVLWR